MNKKSTQAVLTPQIKPHAARPTTAAPARNAGRAVAPTAFRPQATTKAVQPKGAGGALNRKPSAAPQVYRPQPTPKVLQAKSSSPQRPPSAKAPRATVAPPVYRPEPKGVAQPKTASAAQARVTPKAPPAYRPQAKPSVQQPTRPVQMKPRQAAPHAHQCRPACQAVQPKTPPGPVAVPAQGRGVKAAAGRTNPPTAPNKPPVRPNSPSLRAQPAVVQPKVWIRKGDLLKSFDDNDARTLKLTAGPFGLEDGETWDDETGVIELPGYGDARKNAADKKAYERENAWTQAMAAARSVGQQCQMQSNTVSADRMAERIVDAAFDIGKAAKWDMENEKKDKYRQQEWDTGHKPSGKRNVTAWVKEVLNSQPDSRRQALATFFGQVIGYQPLKEGNNRFTMILLTILSTCLREQLPASEKIRGRDKDAPELKGKKFDQQGIANQFLKMYDK